MTKQSLEIRDTLRLWAAEGATTQVTLPLPALAVFFNLRRRSIQAMSAGTDAPGLLAYFLDGFRRFDFNVTVAHANRLPQIDAQHGCTFGLTLGEASDEESAAENLDEKAEKLFQLADFFLNGEPFHARRFIPFDRVYTFKARVARDRIGLLAPVTEALADFNVNMQHFHGERLDAFWNLPARGHCPATLTATFEVPSGVNLEELHFALLDTLPSGSETTLEANYHLEDGKFIQPDIRFKLTK